MQPKPAQRRPARHPRAVRAVRAAAASPAVTSPAVGAGYRAAAMTRPHRVRSKVAAVNRIDTIRRRTAWVPVARSVFPPPASVVQSGGRQLFIQDAAIASCSSSCLRMASSA